MKWKPCILTNSQKTGTDRLNNPIEEDVNVFNTYCRKTPWNEKELHLEGRNITVKSHKFLLRCRKEQIPKFDKILIDNSAYSVNEILELQKFTLIYAEALK